MLKKLPIRFAHRLGLLGPWLVAQDPRRLCKRLRLEGFEHLVAADDRASNDRAESARPLTMAVSMDGPWQAALWTVAYYRGPLVVRRASPSEGGVDGRALASLAKVGVVWMANADKAAQRVAVLCRHPETDPEAALELRAMLEGDEIRVVVTPVAS